MVLRDDALFVYLGVRVRQPVAPANCVDGEHLLADVSVVDMCVDAARTSELRAKVHSQNRCQPGGLHVLMGFYAPARLWRKGLRVQWSRVAQTQPWEEVLRVGLQLAAEHALHDAVYVSAAARGTPASSLLRAAQTFAQSQGDATADRQRQRAAFWTLVCSPARLTALSCKLDALTRSWRAAPAAGVPVDATPGATLGAASGAGS